MMAHLGLPRLTREHFDRWLELWRQTTSEVCTEPSASVFVEKAEMIAERLLHAISLSWNPAFQSARKPVASPQTS